MDIAELSDIQAESGVIGTLIYHPEFVLHTDYLKPRYFSGEDNQCIYWAIQGLYQDGITTIDAFNLSSKIQSNPAVKKVIEKYNLPACEEFIELFKNTARHSIEEYKMLADNIVALSFRRELYKSLNKFESKCFDKKCDMDSLNSFVYRELEDLTKSYIVAANIETVGDRLDDIWAEIESRRTDDGVYGLPSKYSSFSGYFTYEPGEVVCLQARMKNGKSVFLMNELVHKLRNGIPTLVIDSEMQTRLYVERLLSHISGVKLSKLKSGDYSEEEHIKIAEGLKWLKAQKFVHIYDPDMTMDKLFSICKMLQIKMGLGFLIYDYLKSNEKTTEGNYNVLGSKADYLKNNIAGVLNIPVLTACQLSRSDAVADSDKINRYLSVCIKWMKKKQEQIAKDGLVCGNYCAKIYVNRLGQQMDEDDPDEYIDFHFYGDTMTIMEAQQHEKTELY